MIPLPSLPDLLASHGLLIVALTALIEGPVVTIVAAWLSAQGHFVLSQLAVVVILADLAGDLCVYALGRSKALRMLLHRWVSAKRLDGLARHFASQGGRTLILGKLTHSISFAVLVAAGVAKMPVLRFLWFNLLATVPKSLLLLGLGYFFGEAHLRFGEWLSWASFAGAALFALIALAWRFHARTRRRMS